jgi:hypothetical protein
LRKFALGALDAHQRRVLRTQGRHLRLQGGFVACHRRAHIAQLEFGLGGALAQGVIAYTWDAS